MLKDLFRQLLAQGAREKARAHETATSAGVIAPGRGAEDHLAYGVDCHQRGDLARAEQAYRRILHDEPRHRPALHLLGHVLTLLGRLEEAVEVLSRVVALDPEDAEAHFNLAHALGAQQRLSDAEQALRAALRLRPRFTAARLALAGLLAQADRVDEAEDCYRAVLELEPRLPEAHYNYGNLLHREGCIGEAIACYRRALELKPDFMRAHSSLVFTLNASPAYTPEQVFAQHREWARRHAAPLAPERRPHRNARVPHRRLRVGYVSPDFREHAVAFFFEPTLKRHDRERFAIYLYSDVRKPDARTARLRGYGDAWRDIVGLDDAAVADLVRADEIDILVDLAGHTDGHRLLVFARKPAPVQVTWNGYANTTGMDTMDYRIVDHHTDPPGTTEHLHSEKLVRLPGIYMAFEPPEESPPVAPPPVLANGYVTFGSFNALAKVTPQVIAAWSQILRAVPDSRLLMLTIPEGRTRERVLRVFADHGIGRARLELAGRLPFREFLAAHGRADIALDPFPYNGTTTTCQTLWMGVPVITLAGASHLSRVGLTMLSHLGLAHWAAHSIEQYVTLAARLAGGTGELRSLREGLRARMSGAPNTDGAAVTRHLEDAYCKMWEDYCRSAPQE